MDSAPNGYKPPGWTKQIRNPGSATVAALTISDEDQIVVDKAVSALSVIKPDHYDTICLAYLHGMRDGQIARRRNISKSAARNIREQAEHWIEGRVASVDI